MRELAVFRLLLPLTLHPETHHVSDDYPKSRESVETPVGRTDSYIFATTRPRNRQLYSEEHIDILPSPRGII